MVSARLAVDLGTSHTVAVVHRTGQQIRPLVFDGSPLLPSGVAVADDGTLVTGHDAERIARLHPERFEPHPKQRVDEGSVLLGERAVPVADLLAAVLRRVVAEAGPVLAGTGAAPNGSALGLPALGGSTLGGPATAPPGAPLAAPGAGLAGAEPVLTCPADWGAPRRNVLREAARRAGLGEVTLVDEPVAAAAYCMVVAGQRLAAGQALAVFDFGGGTLDVTVVRRDPDQFRVLATGGLDDLGGLDVDAAVVGHLGHLIELRDPDLWARLRAPADPAQARDRGAFWAEARAAKEMLSRTSVAPVQVPGRADAMHLTREELERIAGPLIARAVDETRRVVERAGIGALSGILLVGGSSRIPLVASRLHARLGIAPTMPEQPELPVAHGALLVGTVPVAPAGPGITPGGPGPTPGGPGLAPGGPGLTPGMPGVTPGGRGLTPGMPGMTPGGPGLTPGGPGLPGITPGLPGRVPTGPGTAPGGPASAPPVSPAGWGTSDTVSGSPLFGSPVGGPVSAAPSSGGPGTGDPVLAGPPYPGGPYPGMSYPGGPAGDPLAAGPYPGGSPGSPYPGGPGGGQAYPGGPQPGGPAPGSPYPGGPGGGHPYPGLKVTTPATGRARRRGRRAAIAASAVAVVVVSLIGYGAPKIGRWAADGIKDAGQEIDRRAGGTAGDLTRVHDVAAGQAAAGAVAADGRNAYYAISGSDTISVTALPAGGGSPAWTATVRFGAGDLSLTVVGGLLVLDGKQSTLGRDARAVLDTASGKVLWSRKWQDHFDLAYVGTELLVERREQPTSVSRVDLRTGKTKWTVAGPDDLLLIDARLARPALSWPAAGARGKPGDPVLPPGGNGFRESLSVGTDVVMLDESEARGKVIDGRTGKLRRSGKLPLDHDVWTVYAGLAVGVRADQGANVSAYKLSNLGLAWQFKLPAGSSVEAVRPCGAERICVVANPPRSGDPVVHAVDTARGVEVWKWAADSTIIDVGWYVVDGRLVFGEDSWGSIGDPVLLGPDGRKVRDFGSATVVCADAGRGAVQGTRVAGSTVVWQVSVAELASGKATSGADVGGEPPAGVALAGDTLVVLTAGASPRVRVYRVSLS